MKPQESQADQQAVFDYCVANISKKPSKFADDTVIGSQFNQPLLEFSGSCAGCAETSYARLITQLFGEKMFISNATGCSSIWPRYRPRPCSALSSNRELHHAGPWPLSLLTVYGEMEAVPPQIEEQPVALEMYIFSPNS